MFPSYSSKNDRRASEPSGRGIRTVVFDLDDTLIETGAVFRDVLTNLCTRLEMRLDGKCPSREEILNTQNEIDAELLGRKGAKPERFAASLVKTYAEFVGRAGIIPVADDEAYLDAEGHRAFREIPRMSEDTLAVLGSLAHCELILYTWGMESIQMPRIRALGLDSYFASIHCVAVKCEEQFRTVIGGRIPKQTLMCGDSLKLDIAPAVSAGCHAAHVVRPEGWAYLQAGVEISGPFHRINRLGELLGVIETIEKPDVAFEVALQS